MEPLQRHGRKRGPCSPKQPPSKQMRHCGACSASDAVSASGKKNQCTPGCANIRERLRMHIVNNYGNDTLVKMGDLACGLYLVEFDFSNVDAAARQIFRKADDGSYAPLNPNGFFLGSKLAITLKIEDSTTYNHLVLSVGDKEITVRPGVRALLDRHEVDVVVVVHDLLLRYDERGVEALQQVLRVVEQQSAERQVLLQQVEHVHADRVVRRGGRVELHQDGLDLRLVVLLQVVGKVPRVLARQLARRIQQAVQVGTRGHAAAGRARQSSGAKSCRAVLARQKYILKLQLNLSKKLVQPPS